MSEDMVAAAMWLKARSDCTGKVGATGFCYGGSTANMLAVRLGADLAAAVPFYGGPPAAEDIPKIKAAVLVHHGELDKRLAAIGTPEALALKGKAAIANARLAYELYEQKLATDRWKALAAKGAKVQRPLWASTSTKDPSFPDTMYVVDLVVADTVNTMPEATLHATADHGVFAGDTVHGTYDASRQVFADLEGLGISYDDVVQVLEDEGVSKFEVSWNELLQTIQNELNLNS